MGAAISFIVSWLDYAHLVLMVRRVLGLGLRRPRYD